MPANNNGLLISCLVFCI